MLGVTSRETTLQPPLPAGRVSKGQRSIFLDHGGGVVAGQSSPRRDKPERWQCDQGATIRIFWIVGVAISLPNLCSGG